MNGFNVLRSANSWDDAKKALKLPTQLEGEGLAVWLEGTKQTKGEDGR